NGALRRPLLVIDQQGWHRRSHLLARTRLVRWQDVTSVGIYDRHLFRGGHSYYLVVLPGRGREERRATTSLPLARPAPIPSWAGQGRAGNADQRPVSSRHTRDMPCVARPSSNAVCPRAAAPWGED